MATIRLCSIPECDKPVKARGYCRAHYLRWYRHGDPLEGRTPDGAPAQWIEDHIDHEGIDCLIWPFSKNSHGYGQININGAPVGAHRIMCEKTNGPAPTAEHEAAHNCGKGQLGCIHPKHLRWATSAENSADLYAHGTINRGERNGGAKLTEADILRIRQLSQTQSHRELATMFGVSRWTIQDIIHRRNWGWLA